MGSEELKDKIREYVKYECPATNEVYEEISSFLNGQTVSDVSQYNFVRGWITAKYGFDIGNEVKISNYKKTKLPYLPNKINITNINEPQTWSQLKISSKTFSLSTGEPTLILGGFDSIVGKPILLSETKQNIPLIYKILIKDKEPKNDETIFKFFDDKYDRRAQGIETGLLSEEFWIYRTVFDSKEYYILSQSRLSNELCLMHGTKINIRDLSEITNTLRFKSLTNVFIVTSSSSFVKIVSKEKLLELGSKFTYNEFLELLLYHPTFEKVLKQSPDFEKLLLSVLLSGKYEGYPLHLLTMGPVGTGKTSFLECLDSKYREAKSILEAGNSTPKVLIPSFKEKPANAGYILTCFRIALIDELMKMIRNEQMKHESRLEGSLGQLNMILEQKERTIGSGNNNDMFVKSTAKVIIATNPLEPYINIYQHIGVLDDTTLSRILIWVQDEEQQNLIREQRGGIPIISPHTLRYILNKIKILGDNKLRGEGEMYSNCTGVGGSGTEGSTPSISDGEDPFVFLSIVDSCNSFTINLNDSHTQITVRKIFKESIRQAKDTMKRVWEARGLHHSLLLLDGLVKIRCLFEDRTMEFVPIQKDYDELERLITHMIRTWDTVLVKSDEEMWEGGLK